MTEKLLDIKLLPSIRDKITIGVTDICYDLSVDDLHRCERDELLHAQISDKRKAEIITGRLLHKELARINKLNPEVFFIQKDDLGKPSGHYLGKKYGVAISHTNSVIAGALNLQGEIGLDIEMKNRDIHPGIRKRILADKELESLRAFETLQIWTFKEAVLKLVGSGLRINMHDIQILPIADGAFSCNVAGRSVQLYSYELENIWLSVCFFTEEGK